MTMPPLADDPEASRPYFRRLARARRRARPGRALDGHVAGLARRGRGGRDPRPGRLDALSLTGRGREATVARGYDPAGHGARRRLEPHARLLRHRRGRGVGRGRLTTTSEELERDYRRRDRQNVRRLPRSASPRRGRAGQRLRAESAVAAVDDVVLAPFAAAGRRQRRLAGAGAPRPAAELQRRAADRRPLQGLRSR